VFAFSVELFPSQKYRTKFAAIASVLVTVVPVPWITVLTVSLLFALTFGIVTTGVAPNAPATETDEFELVALALELAAEDGFDEPQPARTRQASKGITVIARRRRMKTSVVVDVSALGVSPNRLARVGNRRGSNRPMHAGRRARHRSGERQVLNKALTAYWHGKAPAYGGSNGRGCRRH